MHAPLRHRPLIGETREKRWFQLCEFGDSVIWCAVTVGSENRSGNCSRGEEDEGEKSRQGRIGPHAYLGLLYSRILVILGYLSFADTVADLKLYCLWLFSYVNLSYILWRFKRGRIREGGRRRGSGKENILLLLRICIKDKVSHLWVLRSRRYLSLFLCFISFSIYTAYNYSTSPTENTPHPPPKKQKTTPTTDDLLDGPFFVICQQPPLRGRPRRVIFRAMAIW